MDLAEWLGGAECTHEMAFCALCKPGPFPAVVVITVGFGAAFHESATCGALVAGQKKVAAKGGKPAPVAKVALAVALGAEKAPCLVCFPDAGGKA